MKPRGVELDLITGPAQVEQSIFARKRVLITGPWRRAARHRGPVINTRLLANILYKLHIRWRLNTLQIAGFKP